MSTVSSGSLERPLLIALVLTGALCAISASAETPSASRNAIVPREGSPEIQVSNKVVSLPSAVPAAGTRRALPLLRAARTWGHSPADHFMERGYASWYGAAHQGQQTTSGERFDLTQMTAAHKTLPFGSRVLVTDLQTARSVEVRINDRGPHVKGRIIDLSQSAARRLGFAGRGVTRVGLTLIASPDA
jgi:rare lipoprotein A